MVTYFQPNAFILWLQLGVRFQAVACVIRAMTKGIVPWVPKQR